MTCIVVIGSASIPPSARAAHAEEPRLPERLRDGIGQAALALSLIRVLLDQRDEAARRGEERRGSGGRRKGHGSLRVAPPARSPKTIQDFALVE
ncbi:hypothetical protein ACMHYB_05230 [Sorangium sp. So ce1128]